MVQDALSRALPRWSRISGLDEVEAYVRRMVVNANVSRWRRLATPGDAEPGPGGTASPRRASRSRIDDALWRACQGLPADQRTAVVLRFYEDIEYAEIAALTGVREVSVRSRVSRVSRDAARGAGRVGMTDFETRLRDGRFTGGADTVPATDPGSRGGGTSTSCSRRRQTTAASVAALALVAGTPARYSSWPSATSRVRLPTSPRRCRARPRAGRRRRHGFLPRRRPSRCRASGAAAALRAHRSSPCWIDEALPSLDRPVRSAGAVTASSATAERSTLQVGRTRRGRCRPPASDPRAPGAGDDLPTCR